MYSLEFRTIALRLYEHFGSMRKTSNAMDISIASISRWCKRIHPMKRRTNSEAYIRALASFVHLKLIDDKLTTCTEIAKCIHEKFSISVSRQLVHVIVKSLGFSFKRTRQRGYSLKKRELETTFLTNFRDSLDKDVSIVSIDESGFDCRRNSVYGYSPKGKPCIIEYNTCSQRKRVSLLMAVQDDGSNQYDLVTNNVSSIQYADFISRLNVRENSILLMDNASIHKSAIVREAIKRKGCKVMYIPPYSPEYNPIENIFGIIKTQFYRACLKQQYSKELIQQCITNSISESKIKNVFKHQKKLIFKKIDDLNRVKCILTNSKQ